MSNFEAATECTAKRADLGRIGPGGLQGQDHQPGQGVCQQKSKDQLFAPLSQPRMTAGI